MSFLFIYLFIFSEEHVHVLYVLPYNQSPEKIQTLIPNPNQTSNSYPNKAILSLQTQKNPLKKKPQITTTESKNIKIKPKQKSRNPATSKTPPPNQIIHNHVNETAPKPNHPKNRNPAKHPTHPPPNQTKP